MYKGIKLHIMSNQEKRVREIVLKAMGQAISKTVAVAEIMKVGSTSPLT